MCLLMCDIYTTEVFYLSLPKRGYFLGNETQEGKTPSARVRKRPSIFAPHPT